MMPGRTDHSALLLLVVAFAAPTLAVGLVRYLPAGPAGVSASPSGGATQETLPMLPRADIAAVEHTTIQRAMIRAAALASEAGVSESPFRTSSDDEIISEVLEPVVYDESPVRPDAPSFRLSSIMAGRRTVAVIDGAACVAGTGLGRGWTVASIDADAQTVVLRHKARGDLTLSLRQP